MSTSFRTIVTILNPFELSEGVGAHVKRVIGTSQLKNLDPFLMMDHFFVSKPAGFPDHPHRGFETVTYMLHGSCKHEDFKGNKGEISQGGIQWMTAGRGMMHSEMPGTNKMEGIQLWVNLSRDNKLCEPSYQDARESEILKVQEDGIKVAIIAGSSLGKAAATITRTPAIFLDVEFEQNKEFTQEISDGWNGFLYVLNGSIVIKDKIISKNQAGILSQNGNLYVNATEDSRFLLFAGQPLNEPIVQHGPMVMNTQMEIQEALQDYMNERNGFEGALSWASKIKNQ